MDARLFPAGRRRPARPSRRRTSVAALLLATLLAACTGTGSGTGAPPPSAAATPSASVPVALASPTASAAPTASPAASYPLTLKDDEGTSVTLPAEPMKIVSLTPAATETLFALGLGDRIVGKVEDFTPYPAEAAKVPDVAKFGSVDVEKIVGLGTQLVIAGGDNFNPPESIAKLRELGVPTLVIFAPDLATDLGDISLIGRATGRPNEAAAVDARIKAAFDQVAAATAGLPKPRVYYEIDATNGFFGPAPDYFGTDMIRTAGGDPLTSGQPGVYQIEPEKILAFDPQVILLGDATFGVTPAQVKSRSGWDVISAVKTGDIRPIDDVIVTRPGPRLGDGIRALAQAIHPDLVLPSPAASADAYGQ